MRYALPVSYDLAGLQALSVGDIWRVPVGKGISQMDAITNNGSGPVGRGPSPVGDAHGQAALLLTESLMHALVANGTISREVFIEVVEGAADVERELARENATPPADRDGSLLSPLANAFRQELGR